MTFRAEEIRVAADVTAEEWADGLVAACSTCAHPEWFHPEMVGPEGENIWCAECGQDFGSWEELRSRLFVGPAMLAKSLAGKG